MLQNRPDRGESQDTLRSVRLSCPTPVTGSKSPRLRVQAASQAPFALVISDPGSKANLSMWSWNNTILYNKSLETLMLMKASFHRLQEVLIRFSLYCHFRPLAGYIRTHFFYLIITTNGWPLFGHLWSVVSARVYRHVPRSGLGVSEIGTYPVTLTPVALVNVSACLFHRRNSLLTLTATSWSSCFSLQ